MRRVSVAAPLAAAAGLLAWGAWVEPRRTVVRHRTLHLPRWPASLDGLRVTIVSDFHAGAPHIGPERVARVARLVERQGSDLVCLLGDFVDPEVTFGRRVAPEAVAAPLGAVRARLGVVAVLGNHDWRADGERVAAALRDAGAAVLENDAMRVGANGAPLWLAGLADPSHREPNVAAALSPVPHDEPVIVLSHDPDLFPWVPPRASLTLSGHTHGGQINLKPLLSHVIPSRYGDRFANGHVVEGGRHLYVTSGVGTSVHPVRFGRPPEIVVLRLRASA